jgi:hypothetical protein
MGGKESKQSSRIDEENWVPIFSDSGALFGNVNSYAHRALRHKQTGEEIEEYHVEFFSESDYMQYVKDLRIRKEPSCGSLEGETSNESYFELSPYIYTIKYFVNVSMIDLCSTLHKGLLYIRKVDLRLKEINDIPLSDQLYLIKSTLEGFKILYEKMGYFDIIEEMIFISKDGKVRVWVHPDLSRNQPYLIKMTNGR